MQILTTKAELARWRAAQPGPVALVPTMGALHQGHAALMSAAQQQAAVDESVIVSIFVNPLQFGPGEDYARYPRTFEADRALCAEAGVQAIFAPEVAQMYAGEPRVTVSAGRMGRVLEGASRPGHFDGVLTVVTKLFTLIRPDRAYFGLKDIQQYALVRRLVIDLDLGVEICGVPIVREPSGLALSSRNTYLSGRERELALVLSRALTAADGTGPASEILARVRAVLESTVDPAFVLDYAELVDLDTFEAADDDFSGTAALAVAARVGNTRLLDNRILEL